MSLDGRHFLLQRHYTLCSDMMAKKLDFGNTNSPFSLLMTMAR